MAIINQQTSQRQGNANVVLYQLAKAENFANCNSTKLTNPNVPPPAACVFNDITRGNNSVPCAGGSPNCSSTTANTNGVLVTSAKVPAFTTGVGYDLATGLGSVNVGNLATAWVAFEAGLKASTTTVPSTVPANLTSIKHGTSVTFNVKVTGAGGTPSGEASLLTDANPNPTSSPSSILGEGGASLSGGSAVIATILPGGTYNISAHYAGDAAFRESDSSTIAVHVSPEQSQLQMEILSFDTGKINPTSLVYGSNYVLRADILHNSGQPCQPFVQGGGTTGCATDATGTVVITDNGSSAAPNGGTFTLNSQGHTENQPIQLVPGAHTLSATYSGDSSYSKPTNPTAVMVSVTQAATTTTVKSNVTTITSGGSVTLTATVSTQSSGDAPGAPGGKLLGTPVQFLSGTTPISGMITFTPTPGPASSAALTATLTTTLTALAVPDTRFPWRPKLPPGVYWLLACCAALYGLFLLKMRPSRRRGYAYAGLVVFALAAAGIAGCGGGGGSKSTPTPQGKTLTITAKFTGDSNYTASSGSTTVTVQ
jgi:hypothetical protein